MRHAMALGLIPRPLSSAASWLALVLSATWCVLGLDLPQTSQAAEGVWPRQALTIQQSRFRDEHGRQVLLNGINFADLDPKQTGRPSQGPQVFPQLRAWGFNCARLPMNWSGLEPEPGKYDETYLARLDQLVHAAAAQGIYVVLDMHQDLYGEKYGDGAPNWATLDGDQPHLEAAIWSDAYLVSPAIQAAFDSFWANKPAPDGRGLQDHYVALWQMLARRYAHEPYVLGYDLMNEPFMGSPATQLLPLFLEQYTKAVAQQTGKAPPSPEELHKIWADQASRIEALRLLCQPEHYANMVDAVTEVSRRFETGSLQQMYQRLADAIREVDTRHVLFLEHSGFCNIGIRSTIEPVRIRDGRRDPLQAYAPHGYDLLTDTKGVAEASEHRVRLIFSRIAETGRRLEMPVWVGEWGAFPDESPELVAPTRQIVGLLEEFQLGHTYWLYKDKIAKCPYFRQALQRPTPLVIAGDLTDYRYDAARGRLEVRWQEKPGDGTPTVVYVPDLTLATPEQLKVQPGGVVRQEPIANSAAGYVLIEPGTTATPRSLVLQCPGSGAALPTAQLGALPGQRTCDGSNQ